ncbi:uncharacterized protein BDZ83DRAFT_256255 [Colletotrichum acutatum]|uniref:Uncharacterized protein n=1 Tax=Glomerella acutata TaxID=27357 RepID=A0AAD8UML2_GLOAC|nr:uncharacterized protein BDZ83DRAFT_256255 [Colletotrichum acutatum]KAK1726591.1 hypothetical protein BDZ83DRAFT_256255 [Colletotrichum acutatum]
MKKKWRRGWTSGWRGLYGRRQTLWPLGCSQRGASGKEGSCLLRREARRQQLPYLPRKRMQSLISPFHHHCRDHLRKLHRVPRPPYPCPWNLPNLGGSRPSRHTYPTKSGNRLLSTTLAARASFPKAGAWLERLTLLSSDVFDVDVRHRASGRKHLSRCTSGRYTRFRFPLAGPIMRRREVTSIYSLFYDCTTR